MLVLFNPAFFYNSAYWGQIESLPILLIVLGLYLFYNDKKLLSAVSFLGAILAKQSSIIFLPILGLMFLKASSFRVTLKSVLVSLILFWVSFLPFFGSGNIFTFPVTTYIEKIRSGSGSDYVTDHAFNLWAVLTGLGKISDTLPFWGGIAYHWWGLAFMIIALLLIFIPWTKKTITQPQVFASLTLVSMSAFLFLTRMHGRYLQPAVAFLLLYCVYRKKLLPIFVYVSVFYFLNLYHNWWAPRIPSLVDFISNPTVINGFILGLIFCFFVILVDYFKMISHEKHN